jgi:hypothetical protein
MPEHAAVDREHGVADFEAVRLSLRERRAHCGLARRFQRLVTASASEDVGRHVATAAQRRTEFLQDEKHLAIVGARMLLRLDVHGADLSAVLPAREIAARAHVRVIEAEARRAWNEIDAPPAVRRNERRPLFGSAVHVGGHLLTVPVELLGRVGIVHDLDGDPRAFGETQ